MPYLGVENKWSVDYSESKYVQVSANSVDNDGGTTIPSGQMVAVTRVRANGIDPNIYVSIVFDYGGASEKIISSTRGDVDSHLDPNLWSNQVIGDGAKKIKVIIVNDSNTESPVVGGAYEVTIL